MKNRRTLKTIGRNIREQRKDAGFSIRDLETESGVSRGNLSKIEHGGDFQLSTLYTLCRALGCRPRHVLPDFKISNQPPF